MSNKRSGRLIPPCLKAGALRRGFGSQSRGGDASEPTHLGCADIGRTPRDIRRLDYDRHPRVPGGVAYVLNESDEGLNKAR